MDSHTSPLAKAGHIVGSFLLVPTALATLGHPAKVGGDLPDDGIASAPYVAPLSTLNIGPSVSGAWPEGWDESATGADPAGLRAFVFRPAPAISPPQARSMTLRTSRPWEGVAPLGGGSGRPGPALRQIRQALERH